MIITFHLLLLLPLFFLPLNDIYFLFDHNSNDVNRNIYLFYQKVNPNNQLMTSCHSLSDKQKDLFLTLFKKRFFFFCDCEKNDINIWYGFEKNISHHYIRKI